MSVLYPHYQTISLRPHSKEEHVLCLFSLKILFPHCFSISNLFFESSGTDKNRLPTVPVPKSTEVLPTYGFTFSNKKGMCEASTACGIDRLVRGSLTRTLQGPFHDFLAEIFCQIKISYRQYPESLKHNQAYVNSLRHTVSESTFVFYSSSE